MTDERERELQQVIHDLEDRIVSTDWLAEQIEVLDNQVDSIAQAQNSMIEHVEKLTANIDHNTELLAKAVDRMSAHLERQTDTLKKLSDTYEKIIDLLMAKPASPSADKPPEKSEPKPKPKSGPKSKPDLKVVPPGEGGPPTQIDPA
jgi:hypothetical protein